MGPLAGNHDFDSRVYAQRLEIQSEHQAILSVLTGDEPLSGVIVSAAKLAHSRPSQGTQ